MNFNIHCYLTKFRMHKKHFPAMFPFFAVYLSARMLLVGADNSYSEGQAWVGSKNLGKFWALLVNWVCGRHVLKVRLQVAGVVLGGSGFGCGGYLSGGVFAGGMLPGGGAAAPPVLGVLTGTTCWSSGDV